MSTRPGLVTFIAVIVYINAVLTIIGGVILLIAGNSAEVDTAVGGAGLAFGTGIIAIVLGVITLLVARGLFRGSNLSRGIVAGLQILAAINGVFSLVHGEVTVGVLNILFALLVISILYSSRANAFFRY